MTYKKFILAVMTTKLSLREILKEENCNSQSTVHLTRGPRVEKAAVRDNPLKHEEKRERERNFRGTTDQSLLCQQCSLSCVSRKKFS
jgi:hypothetical protein